MHSIVEYIDWFKLGPLFRFLHNHQELDEYGKVAGYKNLRTIHKTLEDIMVRRTRKEIADQLPARTDKNFFVEMTPEQVSDHRDYYDVVARLASRWIQQGYLSEEDRQILLISLNCMRMVSDSTYILDRKTRHGNKAAEVLSLVQEILEDPDNKIVIFSQWKRMFDLLTGELDGRGLKYEYLNGDVPAGNRKTMIERFQGDPSLKIFLSTDAGGVGVNLQSGNVLINVDLPWNPAVLEQRVGRIYRLGQKQNIRVYNFVSKFSIEHRILHLLDFKKSVFRGVLDEGGEDKVMLEGFLQSVRSMLEVSLDGPHKDNYELAAETSMPYHNEIPAGTREDHKQPVSVKPSEVPVQVEDAPSGDKKNGIFKKGILYGFRKKVKRWIKGISDFLYGSN